MALPADILLGIYLGVLTGIIPALVAWGLGFVVKYFTNVSIPGFGVVVLAVALAGVNGGLLALADESITQSTNSTIVVTAIIVIVMISLYAHARGDAMGATLPRRLTLRGLRERSLSADVVELVGSRNEVRVTVQGEVADIEGFPPLSGGTREAIRDGEWKLPADLPLAELEARFAERLRTEFELADVAVELDERGRATVAAAPPMSGLSKRVPSGRRAVSVEGLVPTGIARRDEVTVDVGEETVAGTVVSARSGDAKAPEPATDGGEDAAPETAAAVTAPTTTGGDGRVTLAVDRSDAATLLGTDRGQFTVESRGVHREFELVSLLRRAGQRFRRLTVGADAPVAGTTLAAAATREEHGVAVLAVRADGRWVMSPDAETTLTAGDELFAVGSRDALAGFAEVVE